MARRSKQELDYFPLDDKMTAFIAYVRNIIDQNRLAVNYQLYEHIKVYVLDKASDHEEYETMIKIAVEELKL